MTEEVQSENPVLSRTDGKRAGVYRFLDTCLSEVQRLGGLPTAREAREMWGDIWLDETHHSTALEGNALTYTEVRALLENESPVAPDRHRE